MLNFSPLRALSPHRVKAPSIPLSPSLSLHPSVYRFLAPSAWQHLNVNAGCGPCSRLSTAGQTAAPPHPTNYPWAPLCLSTSPPPSLSLSGGPRFTTGSLQKQWLLEDNAHEGNWGIVGGTPSSLIKFSIEGEEEELGGVDMKFYNMQSQFLTNP